MNTNSRTKKRLIKYLLLAVLAIAPVCIANAQGESDEFGVWTTLEASKKINKKLKLDFEAELRTIEGLGDLERVSAGAGASYKLTKWLKASAGYIFIYSHNLESKKFKDPVVDEEGNLFSVYNVDHAYWTERHRFHVSLSGDYKIGRVEFTLRERLQYTRTNSATTDETKYDYDLGLDPILSTEDNERIITTAPEFKEAKDNTTLRSRLSAKWDIRNCKFTPFASVELYTRLDEWKGCDKLRYRVGTSYKINKDNEISLFYLYQDANDDDEPKGHAVGIGYSIDL